MKTKKTSHFNFSYLAIGDILFISNKIPKIQGINLKNTKDKLSFVVHKTAKVSKYVAAI